MAKASILNKLVEKLDLTINGLETSIGVGVSTIVKAIKRDSELSEKIIRKILVKYPQVSENFLRTGVGDVVLIDQGAGESGSIKDKQEYPRSPFRDAVDLGAYNDDDPTEVHRGKEFIDLGNGYYVLYTPLVQHIASLGYLRGYADPDWLEELPRHAITVDFIPRGTYRTFVARGDSMDDGTKYSICNKDKVTGRVINRELYKENKLHLHKFKNYIIVHKDGITIKEITNHDVVGGKITIHSLNPDKKEYPDMELDLRDVLQLLNVIKVDRNFN